MSGGSHNYICYKIKDELVGQMKDPELDDLMKDISDLAHDLEWADSCDYSYDDYMRSVRQFKEKWFGNNRIKRLKGYIDEKIEGVQKELYAMIAVGPDESSDN